MTERAPDAPLQRLARVVAVALCAVAVVACASEPPTAANTTTSAAPARPKFEFKTDRKFDAAAVPAFQPSQPDVYAYIDTHGAAHLENVRRWLRQPSVSAQNRGVTEMAAMLRDDLRKAGFQEAELVPTAGHPGVWGFLDAEAPRTLIVYMMYDVQPVESSGWTVDPFEARLVDHPLGRALMARGATNQKGPERAFLNAVEAIVATRGKPPVNLMVVAEGEEELGSPHFPEIVGKYEPRLREASGVLFPFNTQSGAGRVSLSLGVKGIVYFELEARGGAWGGPRDAEVHSSYKAITDSPVLRLAQALASLTTDDGNTIVVPGYYDAIRAPSAEEQELVNGMVDEWSRQEALDRQSMGIDRWIDGMSGREALLEYLFGTTINIDGIWGGYTENGLKTILPHKATAKLDSRLVPNQTPDEAVRLIRAHLDAKGFKDVELRKLAGYPPAQTSVSAPLVNASIGVYRKHGITPAVTPRLAGSAPYYIFTERLKLPMILSGLGHGSGAHAPNEYMLIEPKPATGVAGLADIEKFYVDLLYALAAAQT